MPTFRFCNIRTGRYAEAKMNDNVFDQPDAAAAANAAERFAWPAMTEKNVFDQPDAEASAAAAATAAAHDDDDVKDGVCRCSTVALADGCFGKYLVLDYGTFCRALDFDPWLPVMFDSKDYYVHPWEKYTGEYNFEIWYPWEHTAPWVPHPGSAPPESSFGDRNDYDTAENHFGWVDHTNPIIAIPMHRCYPIRSPFIKLIQPDYVQANPTCMRVPANPTSLLGAKK